MRCVQHLNRGSSFKWPHEPAVMPCRMRPLSCTSQPPLWLGSVAPQWCSLLTLPSGGSGRLCSFPANNNRSCKQCRTLGPDKGQLADWTASPTALQMYRLKVHRKCIRGKCDKQLKTCLFRKVFKNNYSQYL